MLPATPRHGHTTLEHARQRGSRPGKEGMLMIKIARTGSQEFETIVAKLLHRGATDLDAVEPTVRGILAEVKSGGDEAVSSIAERIEGRRPAPLFTREYDGKGALARLAAPLREALELAAARI